MLIASIFGVLIVVGMAAIVLFRRRSHDDVHSVEHYHRQLHTLEVIRTHPSSSPGQNGDDALFPASTVRVSGSTTVRLTEPGRPEVPPVPPPAVSDTSAPLTFDDAGPEPVPATFMTGSEDPAMHAINHRPRRLGGPLAAVAAVAALIVVLIVTGLHSSGPTHPKSRSATAGANAQPHSPQHGVVDPHRSKSTTATTVPPAVSAPSDVSTHGATYQVAPSFYTLSLSATTAECWVEATNTATGAVLFTATLSPGQSHSLVVIGPATVIAGAPDAFAAKINRSPVTLPIGPQGPFTLNFQTAPAA